MQEIAVYLNSKAGKGGDASVWEREILRCLFRSNVTFRKPDTLSELEENLEFDINRKVDSIISVGGDGTANTLIQKLASKNIGLLVIPAGTANDLATELGTKNSIAHALSQIRARQTKKIDLISVNGQYMATNGGIGFGGRVASQINEMRKKIPLFKTFMKYSGKSVYSFFAATELLDPRFTTYKFKIESKEFSGIVEGPALLINNQKVLGGGFTVAPEANNSDGKINVSLFKHKSRSQVLQCLWSMSKGNNMSDDPHFITFETDKMTVEVLSSNDKNINFFGDGEIFEESNKLLRPNLTKNKWDIEVLPKSLLVYCMEKESSFLSYSSQVTLS